MKNKELFKRIVYTLFVVGIFQIGLLIPIPYLNIERTSSDLSNLFLLLSGGAFGHFGILMLGISPFITSSIIFQLLQKALPVLKNKTKTVQGRLDLENYKRLTTIFFAIFQGITVLQNASVSSMLGIQIPKDKVFFCIFLLVVGSIVTSFLANKINENGIGQGESVIISVGILSSLVRQFYTLFVQAKYNDLGNQMYIVLGAFALLFVVSFVISNIEYKLPIQSKLNHYRIEAHYFPIKLLASSVMPVIFSTSLLSLLGVFSQLTQKNWTFTNQSTVEGIVVYSLVILLFSFVYNYLRIDGEEIKENFEQSGVYFIGIPLSKTETYINKKVFKITLIGAPILALLATLTLCLEFAVPNINIGVTGISFLLVVETFQEIRHQVKGLIKKSVQKEVF